MGKHERRALTTLLGLAVTGHVIRAVRWAGKRPAPLVQLFDSVPAGDPLAHRDSSLALARPLADSERINVDEAPVQEIARLPGVGPALAKRIVADRAKNGAFGGTRGLDRVAGVGPGLLARLGPHLSFAPRFAEASLPGDSVVDLNRATVAQLDALPGIGLVRARAIVAFRDSSGPFRQVEDLMRVPGLPRTLLERIAARIVVR